MNGMSEDLEKDLWSDKTDEELAEKHDESVEEVRRLRKVHVYARNEFRIQCPDCEKTISHSCQQRDVHEAVTDLLSWVPEYGFAGEELVEAFMTVGKRGGWLMEDEKPFEWPFFGSQSWSYAMFGKEEARTFHALIHNLLRAIGVDYHAVEQEILSKRQRELDIEAKRRKSQGQRAAIARGERGFTLWYRGGDADGSKLVFASGSDTEEEFTVRERTMSGQVYRRTGVRYEGDDVVLVFAPKKDDDET